MPQRKVLVTGATGFIGRHLVRRLLLDGAAVTVLVRPGSALSEAWRDRVTAIPISDWSEPGLDRSLPSLACETVFHLAAYGVRPDAREIDHMIRINTDLPAALVRLCQRWGARLIVSGTFSEYMKPVANERLSERSPLEAGKLYGSSKAAGGLLASAVASHLEVGLRVLRLFKVYGPGEAAHRLLPTLVQGLRRRQRVGISSGTQVLDFVHVDDVVEALLRSEGHIRDHGGVATWNVATGIGSTVRQFAEMVATAMGVDHALIGFGEIPMRQDDEPWLVGDSDLLGAQLRWLPRTSLEDGIRSAVAAILAEESPEAKPGPRS